MNVEVPQAASVLLAKTAGPCARDLADHDRRASICGRVDCSGCACQNPTECLRSRYAELNNGLRSRMTEKQTIAIDVLDHEASEIIILPKRH